MADPPRFSILMPVYNTPEPYLRLAVESVRRQTYPFWQLCVADDGSTEPHVRRVLEEYAALDPRIELAPPGRHGGISAATNACLTLADGDFVALLDHDDELAEHALSRMAEAVRSPDRPDMVYSDEDKLTANGIHVEPFFKPDWSPEYFLGCMYTCHLGVYRASLVRQIGGFRPEYDGAQDYDLVLRLVAAGAKVSHVPDVLYHWRKLPTSTASGLQAKPWAAEAGQRALADWLAKSGREGHVEPGPKDGLNRVRFAIRGTPRVSVIVPSLCKPVRERGRLTTWVENALASVRERSSWPDLELIVLDRHTMPAAVCQRLEGMGVRRLAYDEPFNWSAVNNRGAAAATGEYLLFLNDDIEVITPDWIECLLEYAQLPEVGAVGPKLLFPEKGGIQHAGVILPDGVPGHAYYRHPAEHEGYFGSAILARNYSAVTGACLMTRTDVFRAVGGFDESFALNFNDVDFCLRLRERGLRIVYTPYAELLHFESVTKSGVLKGEVGKFQSVWTPERLGRDPFYNPNLTRVTFDYRIGHPDEESIVHE
jgi:GT2 family glycosyltransferase